MKLIEKIQELRRKRNAIILAHNYQIAEVQDIADYVGDSLGLSLTASRTSADVIIFCGVYFMAETAKILSPHKTVVIPDAEAGCPMADMIDAAKLRALKAQHPGAKVVCYVNTTAEVKTECDICCTSANATKIVTEAFAPDDEIIFVPDKYLAAYVKSQTGRNIIPWQGFCPTHARILPEDILKQKRLHPEAEVLAHPECPAGVIELADAVYSTEGMCKHIASSPKSEFIIATEVGIIHRMRRENPGKIFYDVSDHAMCPNMKKITLEKVLWALEDLNPEVEIPQDVIERAALPIRRMLEYSN